MSKLTILTTPNETLRMKSKSIRNLDNELLTLITNMQEVLRVSKIPGVGLSAVQVGMPLRIFIARLSSIAYRKSPTDNRDTRHAIRDTRHATRNKPTVFINPQITWYSKKLNTDVVPKDNLLLEGCLSVPKIYALIKRPWAIKVKYQIVESSKFIRQLADQSSKFEGFNATLIQHEIDHLNGMLFTDRALKQGAQLYEVRNNEELHPIVL